VHHLDKVASGSPASNSAMTLIRHCRSSSSRRRRCSAHCSARCFLAICTNPSITISDIVLLVHAGLATATAERMVAGSRKMEVARVRITEAGRRMLAGR